MKPDKNEEYCRKRMIGIVEKVIVYGKDKKKKEVLARIDTGATKSSIDAMLAAEMLIGPVKMHKLVRSAHGRTLRPVVKLKIKLSGKIIMKEATIADRSEMRFGMLIGRNMLDGFLIDPSMDVRKNERK